MTELKGLGWLPDVPSHLDYTEGHPDVATLLARTKLAPRWPPPWGAYAAGAGRISV